MRRKQRGYTLIEVVVALAVFGIIIAIFAVLMSEMRAHQKRLPMNFMKHPQIAAVLSRLRRDVQDAYGSNPYLNDYEGFTMGKQTLIVLSMQPNHGVQQVIWDFSKPGQVLRRSYNVGVRTDWVASGVPKDFAVEIEAVKFSGRPYGVRIIAKDEEGRVAIDQILQPRAHE